MKYSRQVLALLALCASFFALGVIMLGAFTRLIDAGLGCPDWPGCYGHLTVPLTQSAVHLATLNFPNTPLISYKAWAEMIHRYFAGSLSILILAIIAMSIMKPVRNRANLLFATALILLVTYQIILGQLTITLKLLPIIVTQHLLGGFSILCMLWLIYLTNRKSTHLINNIDLKAIKSLMPWVSIALVLLFAQIFLGAWTSTNYASLSCPDFPFCMNTQHSNLQFKQAFNFFAPIGINYQGGVLSTVIRQTIQMSHRFGAFILTTYMILFALFALPKLKKSMELLKLLLVVLGLLMLQLCIGISNVLFKLPLITAISHNLIAVLLLLAVITFIFKLKRLKHQLYLDAQQLD